jgi:hypothetical protein
MKMADRSRENSGALFKNDRKETDKHPDYTGVLDVAGTEYRISAWLKTGPKGRYMSLAVREKEERAPRPKDDDDEIPF